jgi:hypothetical protein
MPRSSIAFSGILCIVALSVAAAETAWPAAAFSAPLDASIHIAPVRVLTPQQAQSLYEDILDFSGDDVTKKARLEALGMIEALIDRYLDCNSAADGAERKAIIARLLASGAPFSVYEQVLLRGGVKKEYADNVASERLTVKNFKPLPDDPEKDQPLTVDLSVTLPAGYTPYKRYAVNFGGAVPGDDGCIHVASIVPENSDWKAAPIYMTWRGRSQFNALMNELQRRFSIDPDRVMVSGFSVGGTAALRWGLYCSDRFSAINAQSSPPLSELDLPMIELHVDARVLAAQSRPHRRACSARQRVLRGTEEGRYRRVYRRPG